MRIDLGSSSARQTIKIGAPCANTASRQPRLLKRDYPGAALSRNQIAKRESGHHSTCWGTTQLHPDLCTANVARSFFLREFRKTPVLKLRQLSNKPPLGSTEGGRPVRLCLRINLQLAGREADAKAMTRGASPVCLSLKPRESVGSMKKVESEHPWVAAESRATISVPVWFNPSSELS